MRENKDVLSWQVDLYRTDVLKSGFITEEDMRKEYAKLRKIAKKRLRNFEGTDLVNTQTYLNNYKAYNQTSQEVPAADLPYILNDLSKFIKSKLGTKRGMEQYIKRAIKTLHKHEYTFVTRENFIEFADFMESWKSSETSKLYDSTRVSELYAETRRLGIKNEEVQNNFKIYMDNREKLKTIEREPDYSQKDSDYYIQKFNLKVK